MCDLDMNPLYVNPAGQHLVGLPDLAAACQVKVQDYFFPEDQRFIAEEFFPRVLREGHGDVEIRLRHFLSGEPIWMYYYLFSVRDAKGTVVGWATVSHDITERRLAEEEVHRLNVDLEKRVADRTAELRGLVNTMAGREVRMAELKDVIRQLRDQLEQSGQVPVADDPLAGQ
jgi:PAS domain S-box-containing protein